jgi:hypothetical protein
VARRDAAQAVEQRRAAVRQLDALDAAVALLAPAAHEPLRLHGVEVMRQGRAGDAHRLGHPRLRAHLPGADEHEDLERCGRAARLGHRALERGRREARGAGEVETDRRRGRAARHGCHGTNIHLISNR